ncbi:MAG: hypothetical protein EZS28_030992 [Streblomastix strix]|uniref:Reverse transcriptase domain-containing protein n=1 Tax=Streblomastix strix TaxID=222440 RepID=A0A5J4USY4_9EUKA|nr:MAG: hypothetical protein EZS28_030992 [Streblomastix strix]
MGARAIRTSEYIGESKFQEELDSELKLGVVRQAKDEEILHWNTSYTVPKANRKRRKIQDCRELNAATKPAHFQKEDINTVMQLIQRGDYSTHLDMEKAYHHVRVSQELQKYFGFHFRGKAYTYLGLPFLSNNLRQFVATYRFGSAICQVTTRPIFLTLGYPSSSILLQFPYRSNHYPRSSSLSELHYVSTYTLFNIVSDSI